MEDLIRRQAAIEIVERYNKSHMVLKQQPMLGAASIVIELEELPSVQPERKTGHWIPVTNGRGGHQCDRCGCYAPSYQSGTEWLSNFALSVMQI